VNLDSSKSSSTQTVPPILVVDDEEVIAAALGEILRQAKYDVVTLSQPLAALEQIKNREFSVIITDQRMPDLSGLELLAEARRLQPNATRILITGVLNLETVIEAINQGEIFRFIVKPWLREEFLATVSNGLQRYELLRQNANLQNVTRTVNEQLTQANGLLEEKIGVVALQNEQLAQMNRVLEENLTRSLELSVQTLEAFYPALGAQTRCVAQVCDSIATVLELPADERRILESAARLYDIGLVALPRHLVRKWLESPQLLDPGETELIRQHPIHSQGLARFGTGSDKVGEIIRAHHERFDGGGYPDAVGGEKIPWLARLLAAAVGYASSNSPPTEAFASIKLGTSSLYDPEAVRVLLRALPLAGLPSKERSVSLKELVPGMILARAIYSHNGLLLVPEGERLNADYIQKLSLHNRNHPLAQTLVVYC
jgi:response regulator RpfG family c-di-GMP phosphodiesterase